MVAVAVDVIAMNSVALIAGLPHGTGLVEAPGLGDGPELPD
jgi:hypothetical protein